MNEDAEDGWPTADEKAKNIAQAKALREQAQRAGCASKLMYRPVWPSGCLN